MSHPRSHHQHLPSPCSTNHSTSLLHICNLFTSFLVKTSTRQTHQPTYLSLSLTLRLCHQMQAIPQLCINSRCTALTLIDMSSHGMSMWWVLYLYYFTANIPTCWRKWSDFFFVDFTFCRMTTMLWNHHLINPTSLRNRTPTSGLLRLMIGTIKIPMMIGTTSKETRMTGRTVPTTMMVRLFLFWDSLHWN